MQVESYLLDMLICFCDLDFERMTLMYERDVDIVQM